MYIKEYLINEIPVLEIGKNSIENKPAPLMVFYHGWTSNKEQAENFARVLYQSAYRIILPDALYHGKRSHSKLRMWEANKLFTAVETSVSEFNQIQEYYKQEKLIQDDFICVAGVSMGGLITNAILNQYMNITAAGVLMGNPCLTAYAEWLIFGGMESLAEATNFFYPDQTLPDERFLASVLQQEEDELYARLDHLKEIDLSLVPKKYANRFVFNWHAKPDPLMPSEQVIQFFEKIKSLEEAENVRLFLDQEGSHVVPLIETRRLGYFFKTLYAEYSAHGEMPFAAELWSKVKDFNNHDFRR